MRLVLLPGLNGSSALFTPLLAELGDIDCQVLDLPEHGPQDYDALAQKLAERLHSTPFVLLGESFSGPIAYRLAMRKPPGLQGVILAASFLTVPNAVLPVLKRLPIPCCSLRSHGHYARCALARSQVIRRCSKYREKSAVWTRL